MNPMYTRIVFSLIRYAMVAAGAEGLLSDDQLSRAIGALSTVAAVVWSVWKNYRARQVLVTALQMADASEAGVTALVKDQAIETPSVRTPTDVVPV